MKQFLTLLVLAFSASFTSCADTTSETARAPVSRTDAGPATDAARDSADGGGLACVVSPAGDACLPVGHTPACGSIEGQIYDRERHCWHTQMRALVCWGATGYMPNAERYCYTRRVADGSVEIYVTPSLYENTPHVSEVFDAPCSNAIMQEALGSSPCQP